MKQIIIGLIVTALAVIISLAIQDAWKKNKDKRDKKEKDKLAGFEATDVGVSQTQEAIETIEEEAVKAREKAAISNDNSDTEMWLKLQKNAEILKIQATIGTKLPVEVRQALFVLSLPELQKLSKLDRATLINLYQQTQEASRESYENSNDLTGIKEAIRNFLVFL